MLNFTRFLTATLFVLIANTVYSQTVTTRSFHKVIVSPYIEATFIEDDQERVVVNHSIVDSDKLHIEAKNGTLRVYLEGAKEIPRKSRESRNSPIRHDLYPAHAVAVTIFYKQLDALSLRGEERFSCPSPLSAERFTLKLYGESAISFAEVHINDLNTTIYGESSVEIQSGSVAQQSYTCYGEGTVNTAAISSKEAKLTAYGEADFHMNVSDRIKITSFGEAKLRYKGGAQIVKGIHLGEVDVARLD
jgi:hypothetical protein